MDNRGCVLSTHEATDSERIPRPRPEPPRGAPSEGRSTPVLAQCGEQHAVGSRPTQASAGFSITHLLDFGTEARAERHELSARLSSEVGVPGETALSALEAFGADTHKARMWLQNSQHPAQVRLGQALFVVALGITISSCSDEAQIFTHAGLPTAWLVDVLIVLTVLPLVDLAADRR